MGLNQTAGRLRQAEQRYEIGQSKLRPWAPETTMLETAKSWYTGANTDGTGNGWDTDFYNNAFTQYGQWQDKAKAADRGSLFYDWLDPEKNPYNGTPGSGATGVATWGAAWDDQEAKANGDLRFGDVFNAGKKVGNVYDDYDKATADVLVGEFLYDADQKAEWFNNPQRQAIYAEENERRRVENTDRALYSKGAEDFDRNVKAREADIRRTSANENLILANVVGGTATGAGIGATLTAWLGPGALVGGVVGGIAGGISGLVGGILNQDQQVEMVARSQEKADIANQRFGDDWLKRATMNIGEVSAAATKVMVPFSNITQGIVDAQSEGGLGDMTSEFYEVDEQGNRKINNWIKGADVIATLADGVLKWASPTGIWMDMSTMAGVGVGKAGELSTGTVFNERRGQFDELDGWQEWTSAAGSASIDLVQLGVAGGFAKAARASRAAFTGTTSAAQAPKATGIFGAEDPATFVSKGLDKAWAKARNVNIEGARGIETAGIRYLVDDTGKVITSRATLSMIAPSEWLRWIPAGYQARRLAAMDGGAMTRDHMLKASSELMGNTMFRNAVIMGYSEGGEEFAQAWLDPMSTGDSATWGSMFEAYLYGAAGGAGMGLGPSSRMATTKQQHEAQAYVQHSLRTGQFMDAKEWKEFTKGFNQKDFERLARVDDAQSQDGKKVLEAVAKKHAQDLSRHNSIGYAKMAGISQTRYEELQKKALQEGNGSLVLLGQTAEYITTPTGIQERHKFPPNAGVMSATEAVKQIGLRAEGFTKMLEKSRQDVDKITKALAAKPGDETLTANLAAANARVQELTVQADIAKQVSDTILKFYNRLLGSKSAQDMDKNVQKMNEHLMKAYRGQWTNSKKKLYPPDIQAHVRRSVELVMGRHPFQDKGSFALVVPQVSLALTQANAQGTVYVQQGMLKALGGDHDGDTIIPQHTQYVSEDDLKRYRRGDQYMQPTQDENGKVTYKLVIDPPDTEWASVADFHDYSLNPTSYTALQVRTSLSRLNLAIRKEFSKQTGGPLDHDKLKLVLDKFVEDVIAGNVSAREELVTAMMNMDYVGFRNHENEYRVSNVQWIWSKINEQFDILQKDLAHGRASEATSVPISPQQEAQETKVRSEIARKNAGSAGANLGLLARSEVRSAQHLHYSALHRTLVEITGNEDAMTIDLQMKLTKLFMELGSGQQMTDLELITGRNAIEERVYFWLSEIANSVQDTKHTTPEVMMLLANMSVPSLELVTGTTNEYTTDKGSITMLQLLLRRSCDIAAAENDGAAKDSDIVKKIAKLRSLTYRSPDRSAHSDTPSLALVEVFGDRPLHELIGKSSSYISPHITLRQMIESTYGLSAHDRSELVHRWKRTAAYIKDENRGFKDPPWPYDVLTEADPDSVKITAYALLVDAAHASINAYIPNMESRDKTIQKNFVLGIRGLQEMFAAHRLKHGARLSKGNTQIENIAILRDILERDPGLAQDIAKIIPDAAALGVFEIHPDNSVTAAAWLEEMLVEPDAEKAAAMYYFNIKVAEWMVLSGTVDRAAVKAMTKGKKGVKDLTPEQLAEVRGRIDPENLKSRFLQVMFSLSSQPDGIEMMRFLKAMNDAPSIPKMFEILNGESTWVGNQAKLLPWHDDVSLFQVNPEDTWTNVEGAEMRENITKWSKKMQLRGSIAIEDQVSYDLDQNLIKAMQEHVKDPKQDRKSAKQYYGLLAKRIKYAKLFPDTEGQAVRDQLLELQQIGLAAVQNKGVADDKAAPYGEQAITLDSYGYSDPLRQAIAAITAEDVEDIMTNLSKLVQGPTQINFADGTHCIFDISTPEKALEMLAHPLLQGLAKTIIFPTVRDVNDANQVQNYHDTDSRANQKGEGSLAKMLRETTFKHLFQERKAWGEQVKQAHRYLGQIEGYVRQQVLEAGDPKDETFRPIMNAIQEFVVVYQHSKDSSEDIELMRDRLVVDIANALKTVSAVKMELRPHLHEVIIAKMIERFEGDSSQIDALLNRLNVGQFVEGLNLLREQGDLYDRKMDEFEQLKNAATARGDQKLYEEVLQDQREFQDATNRMRGGAGKERKKYRDAVSALRMWELRNDPDDSDRKANILSYLGANHRVNRPHQKANQRLYEKANRLLSGDRAAFIDDMKISEWNELASWCADLYLEDTTSRPGSHVPITGGLSGENLETQRRYSDQTFSHLADVFFDTRVLEAADLLSQNGSHVERKTEDEAITHLMEGLFSEKRIGVWTPIIRSESIKANTLLKTSPVGAALAQEGSDPVEMADYMGSGKVSWERPADVHYTDVALAGSSTQSFTDLLTTPVSVVKLHNHFVTSVVIQSADPNTPLDPDLSDLLKTVTHVNHTSAETIAAGQITPQQGQSDSQAGALRVLDLEKLDAQIKWLQDAGKLPNGYTIQLRYVDVDKKPHEHKWANNIFFDGVGREAVGGSGLGAIASLFFGLNALNKIGQQNPLDMATKKGKGFRPFKRPKLERAEQMEAGGKSVGEIMAEKAVFLLNTKYPMGDLLSADLPSMYKLVKMRHVIVGENANGEKEVWWPERIIEMEASGKTIPLQNWKLMRLSDSQAQTLWGGSGSRGVKGTQGSMVEPTFNIADLDVLPDLSMKRLKALGMERIGEERKTLDDIANTPLGSVQTLPRAAVTPNRGKTYESLYTKRLRTWQVEHREVHQERQDKAKGGQSAGQKSKVNNSQLLTDMLDLERQHITNTALGIPGQGVADLAALDVAQRMAAQIGQMMDAPEAILWVYKHGRSSNLNEGILGYADVPGNFGKLGKRGPVYNDYVIIDLSEILNSTDVRDHRHAEEIANEVISSLARKGLSVVLTASNGGHDLREAVVENMLDGSLGMRAMNDSNVFFTPIIEDWQTNAAQRAQNSTLLETRQSYTRNVALRFVSDHVLSSMTEATELIDLEHDRAYNTVSHSILPVRMMGSRTRFARRNPFAYGVPQRGIGRADQMSKMNATLRNLLEDPDGEAYLKKLLGPENNYPKYAEHDNGMIEHGVLTIDDALDKLKQQVISGKWALDKGETYYWGTIVPVVGGDGSIHLSRIGFKQPNHKEMAKQRQLRGLDGRPMTMFSATTDKLDEQQTLPPPSIVNEVRHDRKGLSVVGTFQPGKMAKIISQGVGLKSGLAPMPPGYRFPDAVIASQGAPGMHVTRMIGSTSVVGKEAMAGLVNNFRDGFAVTGINFEDDMVEAFFGVDPTRDAEEVERLRDITRSILKEWSQQRPLFDATNISRSLDEQSTVAAFEAKINAIGSAKAPNSWTYLTLGKPKNQISTNERIATCVLAALAAPGVQVEHVLGTQGVTTVPSHDEFDLVRFMPAIFTDALSDMQYPEVRKELIARMNRNMPEHPDPTSKKTHLMWFDNEMRFHMLMQQDVLDDRGNVLSTREEEVIGHLQLHVPLPADENSIRLTYAGVSSKGTESKHIADTAAGAMGGRVMTKPTKNPNLPDAFEELRKNEIERFRDPETAADSFYRMMVRIREDGDGYNPWHAYTPMESTHLTEGTAKVRQYNYMGERSKKTGWSAEEKTSAGRLATDFLKELNITDPNAINEVEILVRQLFGIPGPAKGQKDYKERLSYKVFAAGVEYMTRNVKNDMNPLDGGKAMIPHEAFWKMVRDAQIPLKPDQRWLPLANGNRKKKEYVTADDWGQWVDSLMGQVRASKGMMDSRFITDIDGFLHTYQGTHPDYMEMALSIDEQRQAKLLDPDTNRPYMSIDPGRDATLKDAVVLASEHMTYDALVGKGVVTKQLEAEKATDSVLAKRLAEMEAWQKSESLPKQKDMSVKEYVKQGARYQESSRTTSNMLRNMVNASVALRLFNPALYASAMIEVPFRSSLEGMTNILTGQLTGRRGKAVAAGADWMEIALTKLLDKAAKAGVGIQDAEAVGLSNVLGSPRYSRAEIDALNGLNSTMGESNKFLGMVYSELAYQTVIGGGRGKIGERLEGAAAAAARMTSDPKWLMKADKLAQRYNDAVWEYLTMTNSQITMDQYNYYMQQDPTWLMKRDGRAHQMGLNAVQQSRGAKATLLGNGIMKPIDRMTSSENGMVNGAGHLIKLPFLFTRFNANMFLTMTGLHGMDQAAAMFFGGRQKNPQLLKRMANRAKLGEHDITTPEYWDNDTVIESLDLSRMFVRGAVTQTALMAMGMMAGGFSLGGEDEEERRRKRLATYLNTPYYHDPRKASSDFRWKDAIFLDNVPVLGSLFKNPDTGRSAVVPHWIIRQFTSPILGMMRFFETGDIMELQQGFADAISVVPTSIVRLAKEATATTQLLMEAANDDELLVEAQGTKMQLLTNIVFVFEKALFENQFINTMYQALDDFDRNPWAIQGTNGTGDILREEGTGEPIQTEALQQFQDTDAEGSPYNKAGYASRHNRDALLHQYAENNLSAAVIMSILPWVQGKESTYLRGNMVTKKQKVQVGETPEKDVEALVYSAYLGMGGQDRFTKEEIIGAIKQQEQAAGRRWEQSAVEERADAIYASVHDEPLTIFQDGVEQMTLDGKEGVFRSLRDGVIKLDSPAIAGFHVTPEERDAIAERLTTELVQEGVDFGLSEQSAMYRMRRIWYGDSTDPSSPGLREILYDKRIPSKPYVEYDQLNVTYVLGPDGKPWATPFTKASIMQAMGIPVPHMMAKTIPGVTKLDARGNVIDLVNGINTGLAAIQPRPIQPEEVEIKDDAVKAAEKKSYIPGGGRGYGRRGYGGGGGGYGGSSYGPNFQRMDRLPFGTTPRLNGVGMINTSNPIIRRSDVRRERISSERGRLKQWQ